MFRMFATPRTAGISIAFGMCVALAALPAAPAAAGAGPDIGIHPHVTSHSYSQPTHHIRGRVGMVNKSNRTVTVKCLVVALLEGSGDTHKKGSDYAKAKIPAHETRKPHFSIKIHDSDHHLDNVPKHIATHCRRVAS